MYIQRSTETFLQRVSAWSQKWLSEGEINNTVADFVTNHTAQPAKIMVLYAVNLGLLRQDPIWLQSICPLSQESFQDH